MTCKSWNNNNFDLIIFYLKMMPNALKTNKTNNNYFKHL